MAVRRCPYRLFAVLAGGVSNLICEADNELRPLRQILAPNRMIMQFCRSAGKPGERPWVGRCLFWETPVQHGGQVPRAVQVASRGGCLQVQQWVPAGLCGQRQEMGTQGQPGG